VLSLYGRSRGEEQEITMKSNHLLFPLLLFLIISCSSPLERPYKESTLEEDVVELKKTLSEEELEMLAGYIALRTIGEDKMLGKTYGDLLTEAKEFKAEMEAKQEEERRLAEEAKREEAERIKRLSGALTVSLYEKGFFEYNYQDYITFKFAFQNKTDKNMKAFTGMIIINDLFDKEIKNFNLTFDDGINANSKRNWSAQTEYNQFIDEDVTLKSKDMDDLKVEWIPEKIIFTDNTTLE
jgi:hypothetical protein